MLQNLLFFCMNIIQLYNNALISSFKKNTALISSYVACTLLRHGAMEKQIKPFQLVASQYSNSILYMEWKFDSILC